MCAFQYTVHKSKALHHVLLPTSHLDFLPLPQYPISGQPKTDISQRQFRYFLIVPTFGFIASRCHIHTEINMYIFDICVYSMSVVLLVIAVALVVTVCIRHLPFCLLFLLCVPNSSFTLICCHLNDATPLPAAFAAAELTSSLLLLLRFA